MTILAVMVLGFLAAANAPGAQPAPSPGWEFARWGMTPGQVGAASHGAVPAGEHSSYDTLARQYSMDKFKFNVGFDYKPRPADPGNIDRKNLVLDAVLLNLDFNSGTCADLAAYLHKIYGEPDRTFTAGPTGFLWNRKDIGDDVEYYTWDEHRGCTVMYMPLGGYDS